MGSASGPGICFCGVGLWGRFGGTEKTDGAVDGILGLMNVFTYCAVEENKWRKSMADSLAAAPVAFLLKPASSSLFCFTLNWIGPDRMESIHLLELIDRYSSAVSWKECMYYY